MSPQIQAEVYGSASPAYPWVDRQTGVVGANLVLAFTPLVNPGDAAPAPFLLFKNGVLLDPAVAYTLAGNTVTLGVASIAGDIWVAEYWYQSTGVLS